MVRIQRLTLLNADLVYSSDPEEFIRPRTDKDSELTSRAASEATTLVENADNVFLLASNTRVCVIGARAKVRVATVDGSVQYCASWCQSTWDALVEQKSDGIDLDSIIFRRCLRREVPART